ncbi:MAG: hypothetical protein HYY87_00545 [Candidatus Levybacteria bacterium]|nr:hypothetical protein [Candidatus Levybacteria bacterium]
MPPKDPPAGVQTIYRYTPEEREKFRETFRRWKEMIMPDEEERNVFTQKLNALDRQVIDELGNKEKLDKILSERAALLAPYVEILFTGKQYPQAEHKKFLLQNKELPQDLADPLWYKAMFAVYVARSGLNYYQGIDKKLGAILAKAGERGVNMKFDFVTQERDVMVEDDTTLLQNGVVNAGNVFAFEGIKYIEGFAHSTIGFYPEEALEAILNPAA